MGVGMQPQTFTPAPRADLASHSAPARNLLKNCLGGVIFGCTHNTMNECVSKQLFGLPGPHFIYVKNIDPGLPLFLFNYSDKKLYGIYEAASYGQMNIDPYGWTTDGSVRTQYPAQVQIRVRLRCRPLLESQFKPIIEDNYFSPNKFWFELDHAQTNKLMSLLASMAFAPGTSVPNTTLKRTFDFPALPSRTATLEAEATNLVGSYNSFGTVSNVNETEQKEQNLICTKLKELALQLDSNSDTSVELNRNHGEPLHFGEKRSECAQSLEQKSEESPNFLSVQSPHFSSDQSFAKLVQEVEELKAINTAQSKKIQSLEHKLEQAEVEIKQLKDYVKLEIESTRTIAHIDEKQEESESQPSNDCMKMESDSTPSIPESDDNDIASFDMLDLDPNESIYLVGGYDGESVLLSLDSYFPSRNVIKSLRPMSSIRSYTSVAQLNDEIYVIGGGDGQVWYDTVESYCPTDDQWKPCPPLRERKGSLAAATAKNKIFAMGGGNGIVCFSDVEMLDLDVGRWIRTQSMLEKRFCLAAAELNGVLYATGGYDGNDYLKSVDIFDPREHSWKKGPCMNSNRGCHSLVAMNEKLYALGGYDGDNMVSSVEIFDPRLNSWMLGEPMKYCRGYSAAVVVNESIYVIGGVKEGATITETVECYKEGKGWQEMTAGALGKRCFLSAIAPKSC